MIAERYWRAVEARQLLPRQSWVYGVVTTGVYCRPWCPSRRPRRENTRWFPHPEAAEAAGLRACKRCRPAQGAGPATPAWVGELCRFIELHAEEALPLEHLARRAGLSQWHLQRRFKAAVGQTPRQFAAQARLRRLREELRAPGLATDAIYNAGFGSSSRVYEKSNRNLGMTPAQYGRGGAGIEISHTTIRTVWGKLLIAATERGLCFSQFDATVADLRREFPHAQISSAGQRPNLEAALQSWADALRRSFEGAPLAPDLPLDVRGTAFQNRVWSFLRSIPAGETATYQNVAAAAGHPGAARAVGSACARNPVALAIPCHRVLRSDGACGGYRWNVTRKKALLQSERA